MRRIPRTPLRVLLGSAVLLLAPMVVAAQQQQQPAPAKPKPPVRRGQTIEIRGQVPTPQVVTVRPREIPVYGRDVLGARYDTRSFWASATTGYQMVPQRQLTGGTPLDSIPPGVAKLGAPAAPGAAARGAAAAEIAGLTTEAIAGARSAEIESMRHELAMRRSRLDSLQRLQAGGGAAGLPPNAPKAQMSASDSARRAAEIDAIRKELQYRRARLDSLQRVVDQIGKQKSKSAPKTPN
ncbi:MAG TPA: hypothetical protein VEI06_16440 [Gemmatimonadaceae bacterium]|nr:hypothetical protein [Gemmatimonadaceae bacterium]